VCYWGARAIYKGYPYYDIDLLSDRQTFEGTSNNAFGVWLNRRALPWLKAEVKRLSLCTDEAQEIVFREFKYELRANTNGSYGYLYIGAIEHSVVEAGTHRNDAAKKDERVLQIGEDKYVWGADWDVPAVGTLGNVTVNSIGEGTVIGYHTEPYGKTGLQLLCLQVDLDSPPDWWEKQTINREVEKRVKSGELVSKRGTDPDDGIPAPAALKEFKSNFELPPCIVWDGDFKFARAVTA
jgi:hypothetical protein